MIGARHSDQGNSKQAGRFKLTNQRLVEVQRKCQNSCAGQVSPPCWNAGGKSLTLSLRARVELHCPRARSVDVLAARRRANSIIVARSLIAVKLETKTVSSVISVSQVEASCLRTRR
ncbi:uncharacterized protein LOC144637599 [Oculina patagonica]